MTSALGPVGLGLDAAKLPAFGFLEYKLANDFAILACLSLYDDWKSYFVCFFEGVEV